MIVGIANDHQGLLVKNEIKKQLEENGFTVIDYGTNTEDSVDYPDYAKLLCSGIVNRDINLGILICGTGIGMSIAANKIKGIRCAKVDNKEEATLSREHNNANVIAISRRKDIEEIKDIVDLFVNTPFSSLEKHTRRINKISDLEKI